MEIQLEPAGQGNFILSYRPGEVRIGQQTLSASLIVSRDSLLDDWRPPAVDELALDDLAAAVALRPEILLLGTGSRQQFPPPRLAGELGARRIGFEVMDNGAACRTYNLLLSEQRSVVLALLL